MKMKRYFLPYKYLPRDFKNYLDESAVQIVAITFLCNAITVNVISLVDAQDYAVVVERGTRTLRRISDIMIRSPGDEAVPS